MKLPSTPDRYDPENERRTRLAVERADDANRKTGTDIVLTTDRLLIQSPNGTLWALTVNDAGGVSVVVAG